MSGQSAGFSAYISELVRSGGQFRTLALDYKNDMPIGGFERPDGGNGQINGMMDTALRMIGELHLMIAQAMYVHGDKIVEVAERYTDANQYSAHNINVVLQDLVSAVHHPTSLPKSVPGAQ